MLLKFFSITKIKLQLACACIIISVILFQILHYKVIRLSQHLMLQKEIKLIEYEKKAETDVLMEGTSNVTFLYKQKSYLKRISKVIDSSELKRIYHFATKFQVKRFSNWMLKSLNTSNLENIQQLEDSIYSQEALNGHDISRIPISTCSAPFITLSMGGKIGNTIYRVLSLYMFRIFYGIRVIITPLMHRRLEQHFKNVPLPHLPHPCFQFNSSSALEASYSIMKDTFSEVLKKPPIYETANNVALNITSPKHSNYIINAVNDIFVFMSNRKICQSLLQSKDNLVNTAKSRIKMALEEKGLSVEDATLVSVHVRRTDALEVYQSRKWEYPSLSFYKKAFQFYRENCPNVTFVVVSDDHQWVVENIRETDAVFPGNGNAATPEVDFAILRCCDHHIVGVGTFGTASAFLGRGSAVMYKMSSERGTPTKPLFESFDCHTTNSFVYLGNN